MADKKDKSPTKTEDSKNKDVDAQTDQAGDKTDKKSVVLPPKKTAKKPPKKESPEGKTDKKVAVLPAKKAPKKSASTKLKSLAEVKNDSLLKQFEDTMSNTADVDTGLEKADLTQIGTMGNLKGKIRKSTTEDEEAIALKQDIIQAARSLLQLAGTSIEELGGRRRGRPNSSAPTRHHIVSAEDKSFIEEDVSVLTHQDIAKFEATKLTNDSEKELFAATPEAAERLEADPFDTEIKLDTSDSNPNSKSGTMSADGQTFMPYRPPSELKKGFYYYFGITSIVLMVLGLLAAGSIFLMKQLNDDKKSQFTELQEQRENLKEELVAPSDSVKTTLSPTHSMVEEARAVVLNYLQANNKRFAYTFILQNKGIDKVFNKYWNQVEEFNEELLVFDTAYKLPSNAMWVCYKYGKKGEERNLVLIKAEDDPFRIDWRAYSEIEDISLKDLLSQPKTSPQRIRAWIKPDHYYTATHPDEFWQNYAAYDMDGNTINTYAPLSTQTAQKLYQEVVSSPKSHPKAGEGGAYVIMLVRKPEFGAKYVEIMETISTTWHEELGEQE